VISQHCYREGRAFEFRAPFFKTANNRKEFLVIDFVVTFSCSVFLRKVCHWAQDARVVTLGQDACRHEVRGVCLDEDFFIGVESYKYGSCAEAVLKVLEGGFILSRLGKGYTLTR
jgi:hypothetical protein